jgi:carbamoylphosphate synthase small subunit
MLKQESILSSPGFHDADYLFDEFLNMAATL